MVTNGSSELKRAETDSVDGEIIEAVPSQDLDPASDTTISAAAMQDRHRSVRLHLLVPFLFLTVTLLGGLRLASPDNAFLFVKPALICLIFAAILLLLFFRGGLIELDGWINEEFSLLQNTANSIVLVTLFAAATQLFNSVIPELGLPFWIVAFCFLWTLWNNLFAELNNKKLLRSLAALFGFAFAAKYLVLASLTAPASEGWLRSLIENPAQEAFTWLLSLPKYSAGTGYIQFFTVLLFFIGLFLLPRTTRLQN